MQQLSGMDASYLYIETPQMPQHVVGVMVLDPSEADGFGFDRFRATLLQRLHLMPPFTRQLVDVPLHLDRPYWQEVPDLDVDPHLHRATLPAPGDLRTLGHLVGDIASRLLDRSRPLWELWWVDGLEGGRIGVVAKVHHCTISGAAGADMMAQLLDLSPEPRVVEPPAERGGRDEPPSTTTLLAHAVVNNARRPVQTARTLVGSTRRLTGVGSTVVRAATKRSPVALPFSAPRTPINGTLTEAREAAFTKVSFDDVVTIKNAFGTKVNDVVLAAVTQTVRQYLVARDALPSRQLVASVPVLAGQGSNVGTDKLSALLVPLPSQEPDPVAQLEQVAQFSRSAKDFVDTLGMEAVVDAAEIAIPLAVVAGSRVYTGLGLSRLHPPLQSLIVSNMPGPPIPLYLAGARVEAVYPSGPLLPGCGLNITVLSNMGNLDVGLLCCPDIVPDVWDIADGFPAAIAELLAAAKARG